MSCKTWRDTVGIKNVKGSNKIYYGHGKCSEGSTPGEKYNEIISKESLLKPNGQHYFSIRNKEGGHKCGQMHMKQLPVFSRTVTWNPITRSDCPLSI